MKKNFIFGLFAMAALLFATSCQNEELFGGANVDTDVVTYSITTQDLGTRAEAAGRGKYADKLYYGVYEYVNEKWSLVEKISATTLEGSEKQPITIVNSQAIVNIQLAKQKNYSIIFWAQNDSNMVTIDWANRSMSLRPGLLANQEAYDAFWAYDKINLKGALDKKVSLVRPFAQINIGASDFQAVKDASVDINKSAIVVKKVPTTMDLATGEVTDYAESSSVSLGLNSILDRANWTFPKAGCEFLTLGYILAEAEQTLVDIDLTYTDTEGGNYSNAFTNVPVKRNYRTNIYGQLLTGNAGYEVEITPDFGGDNNVEVVEVATASDLQETIDNMEEGDSLTIVLTDNIDLGSLFAAANSGNTGSNAPALRAGIESQVENEATSLILAAGRSLTLDLNGKTITGPKKTKDAEGNKIHAIVNNGNLSIVGGGTLKAHDEAVGGGSAIYNYGVLVLDKTTIVGAPSDVANSITASYAVNTAGADSKLVVNNANISGRGAIGATDGAKVEINGGTYHTPAVAWGHAIYATDEGTEVVINDGTFSEGYEMSATNWGMYQIYSGNKAKVTVNGGTFMPWDCANGYDLCTATEGVIEIYGGSFAEDPSNQNGINYVADGYPVNAPETEGGYYTIGEFTPVATVGGKEYGSLRTAIAAVEDGGTITLVADEIFTETNRCDNGGWWDGLAYSGDKSFTIDLGGYTIKQNGSLNDYLIWIKNDGAKANTITFKNGTMDAGTTAYSAFATASSNKQTITVNLENINLINNISNGAVVKARGGSVLNVKAGTVITGKDSYVGIEAVGNNTVVNVYEGAEIYQNGTSSYVGAIIGASYNATLNIYGGKGTSAKCGIIVMSTGATINVSGGEWTANGDGTVAGGNQGVLVSQNNRYESGWACKSILNVTGGIFKGGYDCWGMGPGQEPDDAQINIKGGNFNADPANYVVAGYEATENAGIYTVDKPAALKELEAALANGGNVTLAKDVTLLESIKVENKVTLDLNGKTITAPTSSAFEVKAGGDLTIKNGKVVAYESTVRAIGGKVVVESGEYTSTGTAVDSPATNRYSLDCREGGELIINGGTFKSTNGMINVGSTVTINGGKFENIVEKTTTRHFAFVSALLTINDGEFYGKANSSAGGCFFCGAGEGGDIQVNGGKFTSLWTSGSANRIFEVYFGGTINVTGGMFNTNGGIATFVTENTDEATKAAYPYVAK